MRSSCSMIMTMEDRDALTAPAGLLVVLTGAQRTRGADEGPRAVGGCERRQLSPTEALPK